jgi:uncharacterized membrane protein YgdD (TMEM256/DUF423 family)
MNQRATLIAGIITAGLAVAIGAFGAHGLKAILEINQRADTFELAVRYQFYHAFALMINGLLMNPFSSGKLKTASLFFVVGIVIFSGSLYVLSLTGNTILGAITPIGGIGFIAGWLFMLLGVKNGGASSKI